MKERAAAGHHHDMRKEELKGEEKVLGRNEMETSNMKWEKDMRRSCNLYSKAVSITVSIGGSVHGVMPYLGKLKI